MSQMVVSEEIFSDYRSMAKGTQPAEAVRTQIRFNATPRAIERIDTVKSKLHHVIERSGVANFMVEKLASFDDDLFDAMMFRDGKDREQAMMQAIRRKLGTYADDTSAEAELGRAEAAIARVQKALAKKSQK